MKNLTLLMIIFIPLTNSCTGGLNVPKQQNLTKLTLESVEHYDNTTDFSLFIDCNDCDLKDTDFKIEIRDEKRGLNTLLRNRDYSQFCSPFCDYGFTIGARNLTLQRNKDYTYKFTLFLRGNCEGSTTLEGEYRI